MDDLRAIVTGLVELKSTSGVWEIAERHLAAGDADFVADLGVELWQAYGNEPAPPWQFPSAFDRILRLLTLSPGTIPQAPAAGHG